MKKIFTLALTAVALFTSLNAMAADKVRRTWDFRQGWSAMTVAKLEADAANWEVQGTGFQNNPTAMTAGQAPWVMVNGEKEPIAELDGLRINSSLAKAKHVQICTTGSGLKDVPCFWLNGKGDAVSLTVPAGENVRFGYTAHGASDRGFSAKGGFADAEGNTQWTDADNQVIHEVELINSNTDDAELTLTTVNGGSHIYYIIIGDGDAPTSTNVMYLGGNTEDAIYTSLAANEAYTVNVTATATAEELQAADLVVVAPEFDAESETAAVLAENIHFQPVVNYSAALAAKLGITVVEGNENEIANILTNDKTIMNEVAVEEGENYFALTTGEVMPVAVNLDGKWADDVVYLNEFDGEAANVFLHGHNVNHNAYFFMPYGNGALAEITEEAAPLISNVVVKALASKAEVTATATPNITFSFKEMETTATMKCVNPGSTIYYTLDGTEPTFESTVYTEPIVFTAEATIKAIAIAEGYTVSATQEAAVILKHQAKAPVIAIEKRENDAVITFSSEDGDKVNIYFNFTDSEDTKYSQVYADTIPVIVNAGGELTVTAFAIGKTDEDGLVQSNATTETFKVKDVTRRHELAHFNAASADWDQLANLFLDGEQMEAWASSNYYFSWGKSAQSSTSVSEDPVIGEDGQPVIDPETGDYVFQTVENPYHYTTSGTDTAWRLASQGQVMVWQNNTLTKNVGDGNGYNPEYATDAIEWNLTTNADVQCAGKASGDKYTAAIESTVKYAGPFNVLAFAATTTGSGEKLAIQISKDQENWETVGDTIECSKVKRLVKRIEVAYDGTDEVYVRVKHAATGSGVAIHDIYVFGENTEEDGIEEVSAATPARRSSAVYNIAGQKVSADYKGLIIRNGRKYMK